MKIYLHNNKKLITRANFDLGLIYGIKREIPLHHESILTLTFDYLCDNLIFNEVTTEGELLFVVDFNPDYNLNITCGIALREDEGVQYANGVVELTQKEQERLTAYILKKILANQLKGSNEMLLSANQVQA